MSIFVLDLLAMIFGMPRALFPALAERLGGGAALYGLLLVVGGRGRVRRVAGERLDGRESCIRAGRCCGPSRRGA